MIKIYLYDTENDCIGSGSLTSVAVQQQLDAANGDDVEVHISSVGGSAFDAIAIYDMIRKYPGNVTTYVDALAASAASVVAMAGKTVVMSKYALLMIHKPMVGSGGNADELLKDVQMLNTVQTRLAQIYMDKTGLDEVTINSFINSVTWMTADQALDLGFIDKIEDYQADITNSAILKKYTGNAPAVYQRCINKILNTKTSDMNTENKDLIEKTASVLDKMMNFFKRVVNKKTVTNSGAALHHVGNLAVGSDVFNSEDMDKPAEDGEMEVENAAGKKVKITIKDGKVANIADDDTSDDDDEPADEDDDIPVDKLKKGEVQNRINSIKAKLQEQNALLVEARTALEDANARLNLTRDEIKNEIQSDFTPEGSRRSHKTVAEAKPDLRIMPTTDVAKNAVKHAINKAK